MSLRDYGTDAPAKLALHPLLIWLVAHVAATYGLRLRPEALTVLLLTAALLAPATYRC